MVYAANGGFVLDGIAYGASFTYPRAQARGPRLHGLVRARTASTCASRSTINEGEGDFLLVGDTILAGTGSAATPRATTSSRRIFGREVVTLRLVDPSFYHLDTAIAVPRRTTNIAYLPKAFDDASLERCSSARYPDADHRRRRRTPPCSASTPSATATTSSSPRRATDFERQLRERGYNPIGVDLSELLLGGGGVKCCTLELRR